jgi:membrane fusion protein (multidrug efflux system)
MLSRFCITKWRIGWQGFIALAILCAGCKRKPPPPAPPEVQFITVATTNLPVFEEWIGTLDGFVNAQIHAQVTGYLLTQGYAEGSEVKKGDLLFEIDPRPFKAALDQAAGKLAQDQALLAKAELDVKRFTPLVQEQALSQETLDDAVQAKRAAQAQVQADEAAVESARLNLGFTRIISPVDGLAGIALAQIGDLVSPSGPVLTTVSTINPIRVYFQASEQSYLKFWWHLAASPNTHHDLPLDLILSDGSAYEHEGKFFYADRQVNPTTGTLQIAGLFPNPDFTLRPGLYGLVRGQIEVKTNAILVPQRAVSEAQGSYHVAVVGSDNKAHVQAVKVANQIGADWVIEEGLKAGDRAVVEGTLKAKEGTVVNPKPYAAQPSSGLSTTAAR